MSAQIYSAPKEVKEPKMIARDIVAWRKEEERYLSEMKTVLLKRKKGKNVGEVIRFPVADGQAQYMVASMRPLQLVHLPIGDAWNFPQAHLLTATEVNKMIASDKAMREFFK